MLRSGLPAFLVTCGLSKASLVRGSARSTPSNATARMMQDADGTSCNIGDLFQHLTRIRVDSECRAGCHGGDGQCDDDWYPGAADSCNADCGKIFEPFWDQCGDMLTKANMGGMDRMNGFYDNCLEELYPPGSCGTFCNQHTFECFSAEVHEACCDEDGENSPGS